MDSFVPFGMQGCTMNGATDGAEGSKALNTDLTGLLSEEVDYFTSAGVGVPGVQQVTWTTDGRGLVVLRSGRKSRPKGDLFIVDADAEEGHQWKPVEVDGAFVRIGAVWPADCDNSIIIQNNDNIQLLTVDLTDGTASTIQLSRFPGYGIESYCVYQNKTLFASCIVEKPTNFDGPKITPIPFANRTLFWYSATLDDWVKIGDIPHTSEYLTMSANGQRMAFRVIMNCIPEEAERGEYFVADSAPGSIRQITNGAQRTELVRLSPEGDMVYYLANHNAERPITTHLSVFKLPFDSSPAQGERVTTAGEYIEDFGFANSNDRLWVHAVHRSTRTFYLINSNGGEKDVQRSPCLSAVSFRASDAAMAFGSESNIEMPGVILDGKRVTVPYDTIFENFRVKVITWTACDGLDIEGLVCDRVNTPSSAPVIVHVHGGPAIVCHNDRTVATNANRYPYKSLIAAGYRVFTPIFRGSHGFSDEFSSANINKQGHIEGGDLGDILSGLDSLIDTGVLDKDVKIGIWGGSYGGYMTNQALAHTDRFSAGVSMYGFVDNRFMTTEGGDDTWETEYFGKVEWPMPESIESSNNYKQLHGVTAPCLFIHGEDDNICPVSQSRIGYNILTSRRIPTGLIVYPGERHGFDCPQNQRDRDRRVILWFDQYLRGIVH
eukprot:CFRG3256T1